MQAAEEMMAAPPPPGPEPELKEYIVTLHRREDLEKFYDDMETPGGDLYIPDRTVGLVARRKISRNTHYMLTKEEADQIKKDPRVWDVELADLARNFVKPTGYSLNDVDFNRSTTPGTSHINWGLYRHNITENVTNWGGSVNTNVADLVMTASGKHVDVVIFDGHIDPDHPEFAVNPDGTGGSRVNQFNWFQYKSELGLGADDTYAYTPYTDALGVDNNGDGVPDRSDDNNHGCHVAGTVAGNTQGWARDATIYNISPYATNQNPGATTYMWDYVRYWHNNKSINPATGRRNPTVTNHSYGSTLTYGGGLFGAVTRVVYRGVDFNPGRNLTVAELQARGFYTFDTTPSVPYYFTSREADIQDAIDDGIIVVAAAGNDSWRVVNNTDQDWDNIFYATYLGVNYFWYLNRGTGSIGAANIDAVINVGALEEDDAEEKAFFSNAGTGVDIYAAGQAIQSALNTGIYITSVNDVRNASYTQAKYQGTSMASPQVCGMIACLLEHYPNMTPTEVKEWVIANATVDVMGDSESDLSTSTTSLWGGPNRILRWYNQRPAQGQSFPRLTVKLRPTSGSVYPRTKIRAKG
jgi:hypothetical protein